mgnify:FL=1
MEKVSNLDLDGLALLVSAGLQKQSTLGTTTPLLLHASALLQAESGSGGKITTVDLIGVESLLLNVADGSSGLLVLLSISSLNGGANLDINGAAIGNTRVLVGVDIQQVTGLARELNATSTVGSLSLVEETVVISDKVPHKSVRHF